MAAPPLPSDPAVMIDEIVEEFLLRLSPEDPELLARAALVSRQWYRVVTGPSFGRRFRKLHRATPPLLGYVLNLADSVRFVPLTSFRPPGAGAGADADRPGVRAVSSSHGRVLLHRLSEEDVGPPVFPVQDVDVHLAVWHPVTGEQQDLPVVPLRPSKGLNMANWDAAVVCTVDDDDCDHLHCHFKVIFVGGHGDRTFSCVYTSQAGGWSDPVFSPEEVRGNCFVTGNFVLIGTALYSTCGARNEVFKYDLVTDQMSIVSITPGPGVPPDIIRHTSRLIVQEDGRLGFAKASNSTLGLWVTENATLEPSRDIDLPTLLPADAIPDPLIPRFQYEDILAKPWVVAFAATGDGVIFLWTCDGYYTIDLKSGICKKVGEVSSGRVVPYVSFWTPAPAAGVSISSYEVPVAGIAVSTDEGSGAGVAVSADEVPVADIAPGAADEGPGEGVVVSANEGAGAGVAISSDGVPVADIGGPGGSVVVSADEGPGAADMCHVSKKCKGL